MEKIAVIYSSKYGHTKKYADWLKEDVGADVISIDGLNVTKLLSYKLIIFACGVYGDKLSVMDFIKKNMSAIPVQKTMVMAVSWYTNDSEEAKQKLIEENFPEQIKKTVPLYVINSGIDKKKVPAMDKAKLLTAQLMIEKKDGRSSDDINALAIIKGYSDQTSKDNLESIKKGIDEFFNPKKKEEEIPAPAAAKAPAPAEKPAPAAPAAAPAPAPSSASAGDDLSKSVDEAFKNLYAPKPKAAPEPQPAPANNEPAAAPEPEPVAPAPEQHSEDPVVRFNSNGQVVVSSVLDAINSLNHTQEVSIPAPQPKIQKANPSPAAAPQPKVENIDPAPVPAPQPRVQKANPSPAPKPAVQDIEPVPAPAPTPAVQDIEPVPAPAPKPAVQDIEPVPAPAPQPAVQNVEPAPAQAEEAAPAQHKNSYMELFASRRRKSAASAEETPAAVPASPAPAAAAPAHEPEQVNYIASEQNLTDYGLNGLDIAQTVSNAAEFTFATQVRNEPSYSSDADMDGYDFIGEESASVSKRALNAVQDMAKAKAAAEKEAAKKAAERAGLAAPASEQGYSESAAAEAYAPADHADEASNALEKMKHDIEVLAEESEQEFDYSKVTYAFAEDSYEEEQDDGLAAFDFADTADYYVQEPVKEPEPEPEEPASREKTDLDLRKLQEEINASIETNRATRERMQAKYAKKAKEEVHNPFAVQFDDEEDDKKAKKNKKQAAEPKRLADPIDPDIFFSRPSRKNDDMFSDSMPEIKFKR